MEILHPAGSILTATLLTDNTNIHPLSINNIKSKKPGGMANTLYKVKAVTFRFGNLFIQMLKSECSGNTV
jgi:hypothetical protein